MAEYQLTASPDVVLRHGVNVTRAPEGNGNWQVYEEWLAAGNTPDPAPVAIGSTGQGWGPTTFFMLGGHYYVGA